MPNATLPPDPIAETLATLWSPLLVTTTHYQDRNNGLVAATGVFASMVPEAPRVIIELTKASLTHDLVLASRVFALHILPALQTVRSLPRFPWCTRWGCVPGTMETRWRGLLRARA